MLHGQLHDVLSKLALLTAVIAVGSAATPALGVARADDAQVSVVAPGGAQQTLSLEALGGSEDVVERGYVLRGPSGESEQIVTGFSLAAILAAAGADPYGFSYLEAQRPAGGSVLLSRHQALDPDAFADGPPVIYATASGTAFLRPSSGSGDLNASDSFAAPQGVTIVLHKGSPLQVRAKASTLRTRPGRPVAFSAIVDRAGSGEQISYSWYFDDGHSATGANARHSFARRGSYDVVVGVTTPGNSAGASAVVTIQVGAPHGGPDRKGGGRNRDTEAPDHGAATAGHGDAGPGGAAPPSHAGQDDATKRRRSPAEAVAGEQVSGLLLSSGAAPAPQPSVAPGARSGKLSDDRGGGGLSGAALGLLATFALLGAGALAEARGGFMSLFGRNSPVGSFR